MEDVNLIKGRIATNEEEIRNIEKLLMNAERMSSFIQKRRFSLDIRNFFNKFLKEVYNRRDILFQSQRELYKSLGKLK
jgi:hypothetical protein